MSLFQLGNFKLHSGQNSKFKIDCDYLSDDDLKTFADIIVDRYSFKEVIPVPTGGNRIAEKLQKFVNPKSVITLVIDDVLTTGNSIREVMNKYPPLTTLGVVLFSRIHIDIEDNIDAVFTLWMQ